MADEPSDGSEKDRNAPTVRDLKKSAVSTDTIPDIVGQYVPPRSPPEATPHRTIDVKPVRLSADLDPRQALTERRLLSPPRPERDLSGWWLGGGLVVAFGIGAWLVASKPSASSAPAASTTAAPATVSAAPAVAPLPKGSGSFVRSLAPFGSASAILPPTAAPNPPLAAPPPLPSGAKAPAVRETVKKRKDPWLE